MDAIKRFIGQTFTFDVLSTATVGTWIIAEIAENDPGFITIYYKLFTNKYPFSGYSTTRILIDTNISLLKNIEKEMGITFTRASKLSLMISTIQESLL